MSTLDQFQRQPTHDGSDTLYSAAYRQTFHSIFGALQETEHVFLQATGVAQRLAAGQPTRILEVGFGTGLNFWATLRHHRAGNSRLEYVALEKELLPAGVLVQLNPGRPLAPIEDLRQAFITWRVTLPEPLPPALRWEPAGTFRLDLILGDAAQIEIPRRRYHAIYHDPFSPETNPELWTPDFFARLRETLTGTGVLATYSARGAVRRAMQAAGFQVEKRPGPPGKREMVVARIRL